MALGRPSIYSQELGLKICERLANGESLRAICKGEEFPNISTVLRWILDGEHQEFSEQYSKARQAQAELLADEIFDIADDGSNDWMLREFADGGSQIVQNSEAIGRSRLRVDSRKWYLSKVLPKKFGEKSEIEHKGSLTVNMLSGLGK